MTDSTSEMTPPGGHTLGSWMFENRRWVHPGGVIGAIVLGGATHDGRVLGIALLGVMVAVRLWACRYLGGAARVHARHALRKRVLVTVGPFAWVRNPIYLANTCGLTGACLLFGPAWWAAATFVLGLLWYRAVVAWEESLLDSLYGDAYRAYLARVPRLLPRPPRRAGPPPAADRYPWLKVIQRERGLLLAASLLVTASYVLAHWRH